MAVIARSGRGGKWWSLEEKIVANKTHRGINPLSVSRRGKLSGRSCVWSRRVTSSVISSDESVFVRDSAPERTGRRRELACCTGDKRGRRPGEENDVTRETRTATEIKKPEGTE